MIPQEKWNRLNNPTCLADYGLHLTEAEMLSFPEGNRIMQDIKMVHGHNERVRKLAESLKKTQERILQNAGNIGG